MFDVTTTFHYYYRYYQGATVRYFFLITYVGYSTRTLFCRTLTVR